MMGAKQLLEFIGSTNTSDIKYELEKLEGIKAWALDHLGVDYEVGDTVELIDPPSTKGTGWWPSREMLHKGARAVVREIDFVPARGDREPYWYATVIFEREWTVVDFNDTRHWHGPVADTPDGFELPSQFDQEHYPEGRKHTYSMEIHRFRKVVGSEGFTPAAIGMETC